jgi:predicted transcriptional regulator
MKGGEIVKKLKTEAIANILHQPCETVRNMVRTGAVTWGVYIKPKSARYGRGQYIYYPAAFAKAVGLTMEQIEEVMC